MPDKHLGPAAHTRPPAHPASPSAVTVHAHLRGQVWESCLTRSLSPHTQHMSRSCQCGFQSRPPTWLLFATSSGAPWAKLHHLCPVTPRCLSGPPVPPLTYSQLPAQQHRDPAKAGQLSVLPRSEWKPGLPPPPPVLVHSARWLPGVLRTPSTPSRACAPAPGGNHLGPRGPSRNDPLTQEACCSHPE